MGGQRGGLGVAEAGNLVVAKSWGGERSCSGEACGSKAI